MATQNGSSRNNPEKPGATEMLRIISLLLANLWLVLGSAVVFTVIAVIIALLTPSWYSSTTQILLDPEGMQIIESNLSNLEPATDARALNQRFIITSSQVLSKVVESEKLVDDMEFGAGAPYYSGRDQQARLALDRLREVISADINRTSFVVNITVTVSEADKAARLANAIATAYTDVRIEMNSGVMRKASDGLAAQLDQLKKAVEDGDRNVQTYKAANNLLDAVGVAGTGRPAIEQQITEANTEISKLATTIAENEAMVTDLARARSDREYLRSVPDIYLTQAIISLRARYHESLEEEAVLAASLGNRHPSLQAARSRTRSISGILDEQLRNFTTSASRNLEKLKNQLTILRGNANTLKSRLNGDGQSMVRLRELERKLESDRLVYESFLLRTRQLSEQERTTSENPQIISIAEPPLKKAGPPRTMIALGGTLFGLILAGGVVILRDQFSNRQIPPGSRPDGSRPGRAGAGRERRPSHGLVAAPQASRKRDRLAQALLEADDEHDRRLMRNYLASHRIGDNYSLMVLSPQAKSSSESIAFNLALAAARLGHQVLLVDAAGGDHSLTQKLDLARHDGLSETMTSGHVDAAAIVSFGFAPRLSLMPSGRPDHPVAPGRGGRTQRRPRAGAPTLQALLYRAEKIYDLVVIDGGKDGMPAHFAMTIDDTLIFGQDDHRSFSPGSGVNHV